MKLAVIVSDFPRTTDTALYRDLIAFQQAGVAIRLYHLAPYRHDQRLHRFADPIRACATDTGFVKPAAVARALRRHRTALAGTVGDIFRGAGRHPRRSAVLLALLPRALAIAADARAWGATHVHAASAGDPAVAAWIGRRCGGLPYSVSCRATDLLPVHPLLGETLGEAAAVRTVSAFAAGVLRARAPGLAERALHVIHAGIDAGAIQTFAPPEGRLRLIHVGALVRGKGLSHLIDALGLLALERDDDWSCDLIGDGPARIALTAQAAACGLSEHLFFHGAQPYETIARAYAGATLCLASGVLGTDGRQGDIPDAMIEALAHARPVIAPAIPAVSEVIRDGEAGLLVPPGDAAALAAAIRRLADDPTAARAMALSGRARVEAGFDLATNARRLLTMFGMP